MTYWIGREGKKLGPFEVAEVQRMLGAGEIARDIVWPSFHESVVIHIV